MSYINGKRIIKTMIPTYLDLDTVYPVGAVYMSDNPTSPASLFGGSWTQITGKFLLSSDDVLTNGVVTTAGTYHVNSTGGEVTHQLTQGELPQHQHAIYVSEQSGSAGGRSLTFSYSNVNSSTQLRTASQFNKATTLVSANGYEDITADKPHNNMPPYQVVYTWKRTA